MSDPRFEDPLYNSGYVDGITDERKRIIKLLEEVLHFDSEDEKRKLFALITGEQK